MGMRCATVHTTPLQRLKVCGQSHRLIPISELLGALYFQQLFSRAVNRLLEVWRCVSQINDVSSAWWSAHTCLARLPSVSCIQYPLLKVQRNKNNGCFVDENISHLELFGYDNEAWSESSVCALKGVLMAGRTLDEEGGTSGPFLCKWNSDYFLKDCQTQVLLLPFYGDDQEGDQVVFYPRFHLNWSWVHFLGLSASFKFIWTWQKAVNLWNCGSVCLQVNSGAQIVWMQTHYPCREEFNQSDRCVSLSWVPWTFHC